MPRLKPEEYRAWKVGGRTVGYVRSGVYYIDRTVAGRRVRASTGCVTREAAADEYRRFELNPAAFVSRGLRKAVGPTDPARVEQLRLNHLARSYRLAPTDYDRLLVEQEGVCAICARVPGRLEVDHDHGTGAIRGLLCGPCNRGIGALGDSPALLRAAADYLETRRTASTQPLVPNEAGGPKQPEPPTASPDFTWTRPGSNR